MSDRNGVGANIRTLLPDAPRQANSSRQISADSEEAVCQGQSNKEEYDRMGHEPSKQNWQDECNRPAWINLIMLSGFW